MALKCKYNQGRCSARKAVVLATALLASFCLLLQTVHAATFAVGGSSGWDFNVAEWADGKKFKPGDILVFRYDPSLHNVVEVDEYGYKSCSASAMAVTYSSGKDRVKLSKGRRFFICSFPGHCDGGLKIAVAVS